ncbi:MAG TPA: diguanylate cyclase, partial [Candidatus Wallbacteria bacterium]|nr:diguanylate cyclase [Candidatus Wallbacteria bacterium]
DHFKKFNDTYGHQQGDIVLIESAKIVKDSVRLNIDVPCRYGGEEFTIIMPETDAAGALIVAERLRKRVEAYEYPGQATPLHVTISLGISIFPDDATEKMDLIKKSDDALYRAKEAGRNNTQVYSEIPPGEAGGSEKKKDH